MDHSRAPVLEALAAYRDRPHASFCPPGHKQGRGVDPRVQLLLGDLVFHSDLPVDRLDGPEAPRRVLGRAEELMADAVGADRCFFCGCSGSAAARALPPAVAGPGGKLLVARDAHRCVVSGLIAGGIRPVWVEPSWDSALRLGWPPAADAYASAFERHPDAMGALVSTPTPYGMCADLPAIADVCHARGRPLAVDEAWGSHLPFHPDLPLCAMAAGADLSATVPYATGAGLGQSSVVHLRGDLVDPGLIRASAELLGAGAVPAPGPAALDGWRRHMVEHGEELLQHAIDLSRWLRAEIAAIDGLRPAELPLDPGRVDPLPAVVDLAALGVTGYRATAWLSEKWRVDLDRADGRYMGVLVTYADEAETTDRLLDALYALAGQAEDLGPRTAGEIGDPAPEELLLEQVCTPREAFFGRAEQVPLGRAAGRVCAEVLTPRLTGRPVAVPGELLTEAVLSYLGGAVRAGVAVPDAADPSLRTVRVLAA